AFRRLNLLRAIGRAVASADDEEKACESGRGVLFREVGWTGATPPQQEAAEKIAPVILAVWAAARAPEQEGNGQAPEAGGRERVPDAMAAFETWFAESRNTAFLNLMEREVVELPLVEV